MKPEEKEVIVTVDPAPDNPDSDHVLLTHADGSTDRLHVAVPEGGKISSDGLSDSELARLADLVVERLLSHSK